MLKVGQIVRMKDDLNVKHWRLKIVEITSNSYMILRVDDGISYDPVEVNQEEFHELVKFNVNYLPAWF